MRRMAIVALAAVCATGAWADGTKASRYAEACRASMEMAKAARTWHWQKRVRVQADDDVFQRELRDVFEARFPEEYRTAAAEPWKDDSPQARTIRKVFPEVVRETETMRRIAEYSAAAGFYPRVQVDVGEVSLAEGADGARTFDAVIRTSGRSADVTDALGYSLKQLRRLGRHADATPRNVPTSWYEDAERDGLTFQSRCLDVNGNFKFDCSYQMRGEPECPWQVRARQLGKLRAIADVDNAPVWKLLARRPSGYTHEDVLRAFGRPYRTASLRCGQCGRTELNWAYEIHDTDLAGDAIRHTLVFAFEPDGTCRGWKWSSVSKP